MSLQDVMTTNALVWTDENYKTIKECFAKGLSDQEFQVFVEIGKRCNMNPFLREIWAIKFGQNPASIFVGRDGYRKAAQAHPDYEHHEAHSVYENDELHYDNETGGVQHDFNFATNRGELVGAFAQVRKKGVFRPYFKFVYFKEYTTGQSLWKSKPDTMITKVAECQVLKMAFQDLFAGTYDEAEQWEEKPKPREVLANLINPSTGEVVAEVRRADSDSVKELRNLLNTNDWAISASVSWLKKANAKSFDEMSQEQVDACIKLISKKQLQQQEVSE